MLSGYGDMIARIYGTIELLYALVPLGLSVMPEMWSDDVRGPLFAGAVLLGFPAVGTFTSLGLNTAEGERQSPETRVRWEELSAACSLWPWLWYGCFIPPAVAFLLHLMDYSVADPIHLMSGAISCFGGLWFLFVYPVARRLFAGCGSDLSHRSD